MWKDQAAAIAGGSLGYIVGNLPGAISGYSAGKYLSSMKRKAVSVDTFYKRLRNQSAKRRKLINKMEAQYYAKRNTNTFKKRMGFKKGSGYTKRMGVRQSYLKTPKRKYSKPKLRIGYKFAKKVRKVMKHGGPKGWFTLTEFQTINPQPQWNEQVIIAVGEGYRVNSAPGWAFTPSQFMAVVSNLFNDLNISGKPTLAFDAKAYGTASGGILPSNSGYMDLMNTEFTVVNSYVKYCYKNNTTRQLTLKHYACNPKFTGPLTTPNPTDMGIEWGQALAQEIEQITFIRGETNATGTVVQTYKTAPASSYVKHRWNIKTTTMIIEPGQCTEFVVQGPKDFNFKSLKYINNDAWADVQKFATFNLLNVHADLCVTDSGVTGIAPCPANQRLCAEIKHYYDIRMPQNAGFSSSTTGFNGNVQLDRRHDAHGQVVLGITTVASPINVVTTAGVDRFNF